MSSPFPGMDPYLEPHWLDIHTALIAETRKALNHSLPAGLVARAEERVAIESDEALSTRIGPDVRVFQPSTADVNTANAGAVIEAPYKLVLELDPQVERFIRILDESGELITVIEFISPSNKLVPGLQAFRDKRRDLLAAGVNVVEIDLVRAGNWRALMRPETSPPEANSAYRAIVRTTGPQPAGYLFPISIQASLPEVPIPLRPSDVPPKLHLQALIETVYVDGRYDRTVDYTQPLDPPFTGDDAIWIKALLEHNV